MMSGGELGSQSGEVLQQQNLYFRDIANRTFRAILAIMTFGFPRFANSRQNSPLELALSPSATGTTGSLAANSSSDPYRRSLQPDSPISGSVWGGQTSHGRASGMAYLRKY
jgi:hypothetical protein